MLVARGWSWLHTGNQRPATSNRAPEARDEIGRRGRRGVGRRADGYHLLESLFLPLDPQGPLADSLEIELRDAPGVSLEVTGGAPDVPSGPSNLAQRAAELLR